MTSVAVIQARMGSSRLPGKVLMDLNGRPVLEWTVAAAKAIPGIDTVIVATTTQDADDPIAQWCADRGVACRRGPEHDVLERYRQAAEFAGAEVVLRLTADCPLIDPKVCGEVLMLVTHAGAEYASNLEPRSWPDGLDCEAFTAQVLATAAEEATHSSEREHVTLFMRKNRHRFRHLNVVCPIPGLEHELWTLDNPEDLEFLTRLTARLGGAGPPSYLQVLRVLDRAPELREINKNAARTNFVLSAEDIAGNGHQRSKTLLARAEKVIPLGSQTFSKSHIQYPEGHSPLFLAGGQGGRVWDVDGNEYVDLVCGLLPVVLGYRDADVDAAVRRQLDSGISFSLATTLEMELAERLVEIIPCAEMVRFGKNGTDATSAAVRLSRAFTGRDRIAVCGYHGWQDWYIGATSRHKGIPQAVRGLTHTFPYNDLDALDALLGGHEGEFAAVVMEPMNVTDPLPGYLQGVRERVHRHGALLVFDEIITGFRYALGGAQEYFGVTPDLACFGKALGNGMPISAIVGRADVMHEMEEVFFSGTFGGESLSIAAAIAVIDKMRRHPVIETLWKIGQTLRDGVLERARRHGLDGVVSMAGKAPWSFVVLEDHSSVRKEAIKTFVMKEMIRRGVLTLGTHNVAYAHTEGDVAHVLAAYDATFGALAEKLERGGLEQDLGCPVIEPIFKVR